MVRARLFCLFFVLATPALHAAPTRQRLATAPQTQEVSPGGTATVTIVYDSDQPAVGGVGVRLHYDSSKLTLLEAELLHSRGLLGREDQPDSGVPHLDRFDDGDATTDRRYIASWYGFSGGWPGAATALPLGLLRLRFQTHGEGASTTGLVLTGQSCAVCTLELETAEIRIAGRDSTLAVPTETPGATSTPAPATATPSPTPTSVPPTATTTPTPSPTPFFEPPLAPGVPLQLHGIPTLSGAGTLLLIAGLAGSAVALLFRRRV